MGTFRQSLTRLRRFLRDPDGNIWTDADIVRYFNDAQHEFSQKGTVLERVSVAKWPPEFDYSHTHGWEKAHSSGVRFQCLTFWQADSTTITFPWEPGAGLAGSSSSTADDGTRFTHPFEGAAYCTPADIVPAPLHEQFHRARFVAYDDEPIEPVDQVELANSDPYYRTKSGSPVNYWRPDLYSNLIVPYPRPSSTVWQDWAKDDSFSDTLAEGITAWNEAQLDMADQGIILDTIDSADALLMIYEILPTPVEVGDPASWEDPLDWPEFLIHYIECGTLERCFGADTDGFIPSLRDYWMMRKNTAINGIKLFKRMREKDRDFRIGGGTGFQRKSRLRLPSGYPPV